MPDAAVALDGIDAALRSAGTRRMVDALHAAGIDLDSVRREMQQVTEVPATHVRLDAIRAMVVRETGARPEEFNRVALLIAAAASLKVLDEMPVPAAVRDRTRALFEQFTAVTDGSRMRTTGGAAHRFVQ